MLLRWSLGREDAAAAIEAAVSRALDEGHRTADLIAPGSGAKALGTKAMAGAVSAYLTTAAGVAA
jgi:3-isopropylmalate dehydrogenase